MRVAFRTGALVLLGLLAGPRMASAQTSTVEAKYHGLLDVRQAGGSIDRATGTGMIRVQRWTARVNTDSNGIFPDQEPVVFAAKVGGSDENFMLPAGMMKKSRNGKVFSYRAAPGTVQRGVRTFRMKLRPDGVFYDVRFILVGVEMSILKFQDPLCVPFAIIIGDDDFFNGISLTSPSFASRRLEIPSSCTVDTNDWTWIRG